MNDVPALNVRSYPAFRMARLHRVYVDREALYVIRMAGNIGLGDAGSKVELDLGTAITGMLIRFWAKRSLEESARRLDQRGPHEQLSDHRANLRIEPGEVIESRLDPPRFLGHGEHFARWTLEVRPKRRLTFQIEDETSLRIALVHLPRLLGTRLRVSVG